MPAAAFSGDLKGVDSRLADRHIPGAPKRNDTLAGPRMRRADLVRPQGPPLREAREPGRRRLFASAGAAAAVTRSPCLRSARGAGRSDGALAGHPARV